MAKEVIRGIYLLLAAGEIIAARASLRNKRVSHGGQRAVEISFGHLLGEQGHVKMKRGRRGGKNEKGGLGRFSSIVVLGGYMRYETAK